MGELNFNLNGREIVILYDSIERWIPEDIIEFEQALKKIQAQIKARGISVKTAMVSDNVEKALSGFDPKTVVVFNWCDALNFNDKDSYKIAQELERLHFCYTGSSADAIKLSENKIQVKEILLKNNISTPRYKIFHDTHDVSSWTIFPAIVKPAGEHCSNGITKDSVVDTREELAKRVDYVLGEFSHGVLVEEFISGSEYMVAIWGANDFEVLPIVELNYDAVSDYHERIYSFDAKWNPNATVFTAIKQRCPAQVSANMELEIKSLAVRAFKALGCDNYGRLEIRVKDDVPYVIDINPNSDMMGPNEMILAAEKLGYSHGDIFIKLCQFALQKALLL
jgi:D-alanine-D-alanine ligase